MAVIHFVFSLRYGDIVNLELATHSFVTAFECVQLRMMNSDKWYRVMQFPVHREYNAGEFVDVIVDVPPNDPANIQIMEVADPVQNIFNQYGNEVWGDTIVVS